MLERLVEATYTRDRHRHLQAANLGLEKLRLLCRLAKDLGHLDPRRYEHAARAIDETGRLVGGWRMRRRRADGLFDRVAAFDALCAAALRAAAGKRRAPGPAFLTNLETEVLRLERKLRAGTWRPDGYVSFEVRDPKWRLISAAPFRDRVVHHAVHAVIAPLFERGFIDHTYANRVGKGTHRAVARYERLRDRHRHVLRGGSPVGGRWPCSTASSTRRTLRQAQPRRKDGRRSVSSTSKWPRQSGRYANGATTVCTARARRRADRAGHQ